MAYLAPGYALLFLMYTATNAGRMLLVEKRQGTLPRLLVSPTTAAQVLTGKMIGSYMTGMLQMLILIAASSILFQLKWGDPLAVLILVLASVFGAVGWGMLLSALIKTPGQAASVGSALMLTFGILGGSFFDLGALPEWVQTDRQDHPELLGPGRLYDPGSGCRVGADLETPAGTDDHGPGPVHRFLPAVQTAWIDGGQVRKP